MYSDRFLFNWSSKQQTFTWIYTVRFKESWWQYNKYLKSNFNRWIDTHYTEWDITNRLMNELNIWKKNILNFHLKLHSIKQNLHIEIIMPFEEKMNIFFIIKFTQDFQIFYTFLNNISIVERISVSSKNSLNCKNIYKNSMQNWKNT